MSARRDEAAELQEALSAERGRIVRLCARFTGDATVAEDLAQETLLEAWRHEHKLRNRAARRSWLSGIAHNVCLRWARRHGRERARLVRLGAAGDELPDSQDVAAELERAEAVALLERALALLPPETRQLLVQRYLEGRPQAELAARLEVSEGAVAARLHRARLALRRALAQPHARGAAGRQGGEGSAPAARPGESPLARAIVAWDTAALTLAGWMGACWQGALVALATPVLRPRTVACPAAIPRGGRIRGV